jgi:hypothetical protein
MRWRVAGVCAIGLLFLACDRPKADDGRPELQRLEAVNEALAARIDVLERSRDALDRRVACAETYRTVLAAWREHAGATRARAEGTCVGPGNICADTGLPSNTITSYFHKVSRSIDAIDAPATLADARFALPELPDPPVKSAENDRMRETRVAAERATDGYLRDCAALVAASADLGAPPPAK